MAVENDDGDTYSEDFFLRLGFEALGDLTHGRSQRTAQIVIFKNNYGASPSTVSSVWADLVGPLLGQDRVDKMTNPVYLLVMYKWLKSYSTESELKTAFGGMAVKTIRYWCGFFVKRVAKLRVEKIDKHWNNTGGLLLGRTVDGIHYLIKEPRPFSKTMSSHKHGGKSSLMYEFVVATDKPRLLWLNGPFPAGIGDQRVYAEKGLKAAIEKIQMENNSPEFRIIADSGYYKLAALDTLAFRNEFDPREIEWFKDRALSRHESYNRLTKVYNILDTKFRHDRSSDNPHYDFPNHKAVVETICVTIQYALDAGEVTLLDPYPS